MKSHTYVHNPTPCKIILPIILVLALIPCTIHAGYLGVQVQDKKGTGTEQSGVIVVKVTTGGPAAHAQVQPGDLIIAIDGKSAESAASVSAIARRATPGTPLALKILREGRLVPVTVIVGEAPEEMSLYQRGQENLEKGLNEKAISDFTKAIGLNPGNSHSYFYRAKAYEKLGKYDLAIADYTKVIELTPREFFTYVNRGRAYENMKLYDQAIKDFTKAIEIEPKIGPTYYERGLMHFLKGDNDQAIADCTKALDLLPIMDIAYHLRADSYRKKGMKREAMADYERAAAAYIEKGLVEAKGGDFDAALRKFDSAIKLNTPKHTFSAYYNRGVIYEKKGDNLKAINDFSEAIRLNPKYAEAYLRRGYVFAQKLQDYDNARKDWETVLKIGSSGKTADAARKSLKSLEQVQKK